MTKYSDLATQLAAKGADLSQSIVGQTIADDMLEHISGGQAWGRVWLRVWGRIIIVIREA